MSTPAIKVPVVTPGNLGPQFYKDPGTAKFRINANSTDPTNILATGTDGGALLSQANLQSKQLTYTFGYDNAAKKITLYEYSNGVASVKSTIDPTVFDMTVNGGSLTNGILTLQESNGGATVTIDLNDFLRTLSIANSNGNGIALSGTGKMGSPITATIVLDPVTSNILKLGVNGARVDTQDILTFLNACTTITLGLVADDANGVIAMTVGGSKTTAASVVITDANGVRIGSLFA